VNKVKQWRKAQRRSWKPKGPGKDGTITDLRTQVHNLEHRADDLNSLLESTKDVMHTSRKVLDLATKLGRKIRTSSLIGRERSVFDESVAQLQDFQMRVERSSERAARRERCLVPDGLVDIQKRGLMGGARNELWDHMIYHATGRPFMPVTGQHFYEAAIGPIRRESNKRYMRAVKQLYDKKKW
jgi:hypothetical protein